MSDMPKPCRLGLRTLPLEICHFLNQVLDAGSDLLATVPQMIAAAAAGVIVQDHPMKIAPARVLMVWHSTMHQDSANQWLRTTLGSLDLRLGRQGKA